MAQIIVTGGTRLTGRVRIEGAKNAVLPILAAAILSDEPSVINEVPPLEDVWTIIELLRRLGVKATFTGDRQVTVDPSGLRRVQAPYELVRKMRASLLVLGPLLARLGRAKSSLPGGCAIGSRPIDLHLKGFDSLGARIRIGRGFVDLKVRSLIGNRVYLDFPSVTATENIMMAATLAKGQTIIENAAEEPEVVDLASFINAMGGRVVGAGTNVVKIDGVEKLSGTEYTVIPDRIEAGTYLVAAAITRGDVVLENVVIEHLKPVVAKLKEAGVEIIELSENEIRLNATDRPRAVDVKTMPYPGFPTDMQAPMMALMTIAEGTSVISETVFENRFMHTDELKRMGAVIKIEGRSAIIKGQKRLSGAPVRATDLRAGAALVCAGLVAEGKTLISEAGHIDRGYYGIVPKLESLGADIQYLKD